MEVTGLKLIEREIETEGFFVKFIATQHRTAFFPGTIQHRDVKQPGPSYEDEYRGNAVAGTVTKGKIDVRFHERFCDEDIERLLGSLLSCPGMGWASEFTRRYQGRTLPGA